MASGLICKKEYTVRWNLIILEPIVRPGREEQLFWSQWARKSTFKMKKLIVPAHEEKKDEKGT